LFFHVTFVTKSFFGGANSTSNTASISYFVLPVKTRSLRGRLIRLAWLKPNQWHAHRCCFALPEMEITRSLHARSGVSRTCTPWSGGLRPLKNPCTSRKI